MNSAPYSRFLILTFFTSFADFVTRSVCAVLIGLATTGGDEEQFEEILHV